MRKVMLLAAMLAMVLVAAAPAFAQVTSDDDVTGQYVDCSQVALIVANQGQYGDAVDEAAIAAELDITVEQVNGCLGGVDVGGDDGNGVVGHDDDGDGAVDEGGEAAAEEGGEESAAAAASGGTLPDTGGASLLALGAGALLVGGGLLARRIVR